MGFYDRFFDGVFAPQAPPMTDNPANQSNGLGNGFLRNFLARAARGRGIRGGNNLLNPFVYQAPQNIPQPPNPFAGATVSNVQQGVNQVPNPALARAPGVGTMRDYTINKQSMSPRGTNNQTAGSYQPIGPIVPQRRIILPRR